MDLYAQGGGRGARHRISGTPPNSEADISPVGWESSVSSFDYDHIHKRMFSVNAGTSNRIMKSFDKDFLDPTTILTLTSSFLFENDPAVDPVNQLIYYFTRDDPTPAITRYLRKINHDGTGDTLISSTVTFESSAAAPDLTYARSIGKLFFHVEKVTNNACEIRRINTDGTGDTVIFTGATNSSIRLSADWDNAHDKYYFVYATSGPTQCFIRRCDSDGSNLETIFTGPDSSVVTNRYIINSVQYSHKEHKVYWIQYAPTDPGSWDIDSGLFRMDADGVGDPELVITLEDIGASGTIVNRLRLGCGFETTGAGSLA